MQKKLCFSERLKKSRKEKKLTQKDLAKLVGISRSLISDYENQNINPTIRNLTKLANALNVSSDYLLGIELEPTQEANLKVKENIKNLVTNLEMLYFQFEDITRFRLDEIKQEIEKL